MTSPAEQPRSDADVGLSPFDTPASAITRFLIEVVAWVAGPWAAAAWLGNGWIALPVLVVLVAIPAVFSTNGDKKSVVVATPGPIRIAIEMLLLVVAIIGAATVWPAAAAIAVVVLGLAMLATGARRYRWLARGAPTTVRPDSE